MDLLIADLYTSVNILKNLKNWYIHIPVERINYTHLRCFFLSCIAFIFQPLRERFYAVDINSCVIVPASKTTAKHILLE